MPGRVGWVLTSLVSLSLMTHFDIHSGGALLEPRPILPEFYGGFPQPVYTNEVLLSEIKPGTFPYK